MRVRITEDLKGMVKMLLTSHTTYQDSDYKLCAHIWHTECTTVGHDFFTAYSRELLTPSESITRCRRKVQEVNPFLRGTRYDERHSNQTTVQDDLGYGQRRLDI